MTTTLKIEAIRTELSDYLGKCESCGQLMYASGKRRSAATTAVTAHGPNAGETHLYCQPCWRKG